MDAKKLRAEMPAAVRKSGFALSSALKLHRGDQEVVLEAVRHAAER